MLIDLIKCHFVFCIISTDDDDDEWLLPSHHRSYHRCGGCDLNVLFAFVYVEIKSNRKPNNVTDMCSYKHHWSADRWVDFAINEVQM